MNKKIEIIDRGSYQDPILVIFPKNISSILQLSLLELALYAFFKAHAGTCICENEEEYETLLDMLGIGEAEFFDTLDGLESCKVNKKGKYLINVKKTDTVLTITLNNVDLELGGSNE